MSDRKSSVVTVRMTRQQHQWLKDEAHRERLSMNTLVIKRCFPARQRLPVRPACCCDDVPSPCEVRIEPASPDDLQHCEHQHAVREDAARPREVPRP